MRTRPKTVPVGPGTKVTLKFSLYLKGGDLIDSTGNKPASCVIGDESLLPGFERAMFGMRAGEKEVFNISPENGFGLSNPENIQVMQAALFKDVDKKTILELSEELVDISKRARDKYQSKDANILASIFVRFKF